MSLGWPMSGPPPVLLELVAAAEEAESPLVVVSPVVAPVVGSAPPAPPTPAVVAPVLCWAVSTDPQAAVKTEAAMRPVKIRGKARMNSSLGRRRYNGRTIPVRAEGSLGKKAAAYTRTGSRSARFGVNLLRESVPH